MLESIPFFHRQKWGWMGHCHQGGSNWNPRPKKMVISRINRTYHQTMCVNLADLAIIWGHHCSNWQHWYQSFVTLSESPKRTHWCIMDLSLKPTASLGDRLFDTARLWILLHAALVAPAPEMLVEKSNMSRTCISHEVPQNSMVCNIPHCINKLKTCNRIVSPPKSNSYIYIYIYFYHHRHMGCIMFLSNGHDLVEILGISESPLFTACFMAHICHMANLGDSVIKKNSLG